MAPPLGFTWRHTVGGGLVELLPLVASLLLVVRPGAPSSFLLLLVRHLLHLVTKSDALVPSSVRSLLVFWV